MPTKAELEQKLKTLKEEKEKLESVSELKDKQIVELKGKTTELEQKNKELKKENNKLKRELSKVGNTLEELLEENEELKKLKNVHIHNSRGAGRKKDTHLEVYLLSCWAKEMKDNEIIGSEYDGFNRKKKVSRASYYRIKKRLYQKNNDTATLSNKKKETNGTW